MPHVVGELITNAIRASIGSSSAGVSEIVNRKFDAVPVAIVWPSGRPASVRRWTSTVTGPADGHEMPDRPKPTSDPCAPTVTTCASLRPPGPPKEIGGCSGPPVCCSRASTRSVSACVAVCGVWPGAQLEAAQSTTCATNENVPVFVGTPLSDPLLFNVIPGGSDPDWTLKLL